MSYYWGWFRGDFLNETMVLKDGTTVEKYPLKYNSIRDFARKHQAFLFGEAPDGPNPLIMSNIVPRMEFGAEEVNQEDAKFAKLLENAITEIWVQSHGRAIMQEGGLLSQVLGGWAFQLQWKPDEDDVRIPIFVKGYSPEYILATPRNGDPWSLLSCFIVYRIPALVAQKQYGYTNDGGEVAGTVVYTEEWTEEYSTVCINGTPIKDEEGDWKERKHPYGFVPIVYIPHERTGGFPGTSHVEDQHGLARELNGRLADMGTAIVETVHRVRYAWNLSSNPTPRKLGKGEHSVEVIDLGRQSPAQKDPPTVKAEDPPSFPPAFGAFTDTIWKFLQRTGHLPPVTFGEDEGSQRSGATLEVRMWAATSHTRGERTYWTEGKNMLDTMIVKMLVIKMAAELKLPKDILKKVFISQRWYPQIPRDRAGLLTEITSRVTNHLMSPQMALEVLGDVSNPKQELAQIREWAEWLASIQQPQPFGQSGGGKPPQQSGSTPGGSKPNVGQPAK
jgi:hypothetical protein